MYLSAPNWSTRSLWHLDNTYAWMQLANLSLSAGPTTRSKMVLHGSERYSIVASTTMGTTLSHRCLPRSVCMECSSFGLHLKIEGAKNCHKCTCICKSHNTLFHKDVTSALAGFVCGLFILVKLEIGVMMMIMTVHIYSHHQPDFLCYLIILSDLSYIHVS